MLSRQTKIVDGKMTDKEDLLLEKVKTLIVSSLLQSYISTIKSLEVTFNLLHHNGGSVHSPPDREQITMQ